MPGYPLLLAAGYRVFGVTLAWGYALNVMLVAAMQLALFSTVSRLAGDFWGLLSAAAVGLHPTFVVATSIMGTDVPGTAFLALATSALWGSLRQRGPRALGGATMSGLAMGAAIHCRPVLAGLAPVLVICTFGLHTKGHRDASNGGLQAIGFSLALLLTLAPWFVRNYLVFGDPMFTSSGNAVGFYQDNVETPVNPIDQRDPVVGEPDEVKRAAMAKARAMAWIRANPGKFALRGVRRVQMTFATEHDVLHAAGVLGPEERPADVLPPLTRRGVDFLSNLSWGFLAGLMLAALWLGARKGLMARHGDAPSFWYLALGFALLLLIVAVVFIAVATSRYHFPWNPFAYGGAAVLLGMLGRTSGRDLGSNPDSQGAADVTSTERASAAGT